MRLDQIMEQIEEYAPGADTSAQIYAHSEADSIVLRDEHGTFVLRVQVADL